MFSLLQVAGIQNRTEFIDSDTNPEPLIWNLLSEWHEDSSKFKLFYVTTEDQCGNEYVYATISSGDNPNLVTVSRTGGASQWFSVRYIEKNGRHHADIQTFTAGMAKSV